MQNIIQLDREKICVIKWFENWVFDPKDINRMNDLLSNKYRKSQHPIDIVPLQNEIDSLSKTIGERRLKIESIKIYHPNRLKSPVFDLLPDDLLSINVEIQLINESISKMPKITLAEKMEIL